MVAIGFFVLISGHIQWILTSKGEVLGGTQANIDEVPGAAQNNIDQLYNEILTGIRILNATKDMDPKEYNITELERNEQACTAEGQVSSSWRGPERIIGSLKAGWKYLWAGARPSDPKLNYIRDQSKQFIGAAKMRGDQDSAEAVQDVIGQPNYRDAFANWVKNRKLEFEKAVSAALVNKDRISGKYVDQAGAIRAK